LALATVALIISHGCRQTKRDDASSPRETGTAASGANPSLSPTDQRGSTRPADAAACQWAASGENYRVPGLDVVADPRGRLDIAFHDALEALEACPSAEPQWYLLARTSELGVGHFPIQVLGVEVSDAPQAVRLATDRNPSSPRIRTVLARISGDVPAALEADAFDPAYVPAQVALASALTAAGAADEALRKLASFPRADEIPGTHTVRARALLAQGKLSAAITEARRDCEFVSNWGQAPEPGLSELVQRDAEETLGLALLASHSREATRHLERAARHGSVKAAQSLLRDKVGQ